MGFAMKIESITARIVLIPLAALMLLGCANGEEKDRDYFTSGSRDADQRAEQRMAKVEQLRGGEEGEAEIERTLYERLGGQQGLTAIVDDFVNRALADPRVNWERKGVRTGSLLPWRNDPVEWTPDARNVARMKKHIVQFLSLATGGPTQYEGREMKRVHQGLRISNAEFDAAVGDLKATLDALGVPDQEQKELMSIVESTRPQVVEER